MTEDDGADRTRAERDRVRHEGAACVAIASPSSKLLRSGDTAASVRETDTSDTGRGASRAVNYNDVMRTMKPVHDAGCSVACTADIIGSKWTAVLVHDLSEGPRRFSELERSLPGISPRTLSERLRALEQEGILVRRSYPESPPRVEYELTDKGEALLPIIDQMRNFGREWLVPERGHAHEHVGAAEPVGAGSA